MGCIMIFQIKVSDRTETKEKEPREKETKYAFYLWNRIPQNAIYTIEN